MAFFKTAPFRCLLAGLFCCLSTNLFFGCAPTHSSLVNPNADGVADARGIYEQPEIMPEFPGGASAYIKYMRTNLQYPPAALADNVQGKVIVRFILDSTGTIVDPRIQQSLRDDCDAEALRIIQQMPRWKPGRQKGRAVSTWCNAPIAFATRLF
jgi:TonB family protein